MKEAEDPLTIECCKILQQFVYIDDILLGVQDEDKTIEVTKDIRRIFQTMNIKLSNFDSNSVKVLKEIKQEISGEDGNDKKEVGLSKQTKVLGTM